MSSSSNRYLVSGGLLVAAIGIVGISLSGKPVSLTGDVTEPPPGALDFMHCCKSTDGKTATCALRCADDQNDSGVYVGTEECRTACTLNPPVNPNERSRYLCCREGGKPNTCALSSCSAPQKADNLTYWTLNACNATCPSLTLPLTPPATPQPPAQPPAQCELGAACPTQDPPLSCALADGMPRFTCCDNKMVPYTDGTCNKNIPPAAPLPDPTPTAPVNPAPAPSCVCDNPFARTDYTCSPKSDCRDIDCPHLCKTGIASSAAPGAMCCQQVDSKGNPVQSFYCVDKTTSPPQNCRVDYRDFKGYDSMTTCTKNLRDGCSK